MNFSFMFICIIGRDGRVQRYGFRVRSNRKRQKLHHAGRHISAESDGNFTAGFRSSLREYSRSRGNEIPRIRVLSRDLQYNQLNGVIMKYS